MHCTHHDSEIFSDACVNYENLITAEMVDTHKVEEKYQNTAGNIHPADSKLPSQYVAALQVSNVSTTTWRVPDKAKSPRIKCMMI